MRWPLTQLPRIPGVTFYFSIVYEESKRTHHMPISPALAQIKYLSEKSWEEAGRVEEGENSRSGWREGKPGEWKVEPAGKSWLGGSMQILKLN